MYLHRLTLRAIGPFAGEHTIEFAELGASGLFLLEGPTGSGKSTVIDAVVFALYGGLASDNSSKDRLHSHHAAAGVEPFVELVFEVPGGVHRIRRTPQHLRRKRSGTGTTQQNASVTLTRLPSPDATDGEVISTSTQEAGAEIARILGLSRQQFVQTVVLPQGEFAEFLRSSGEDRRQLLESLFGTEIYESTQARLSELRRAAHTELKTAQDAVTVATERLREATGDDELEASAGAARVKHLVADAETKAEHRERARTARDVARENRDAQLRLGEGLRRRAELLDRHTQLQQACADIDRQRLRLDVAVRARAVTETVRGFRRSQDRFNDATQRLSAARALTAFGALPRAEQVARRDALTSELATANELAELELGLPRRQNELEAAEGQLEVAESEIDEQERVIAARPAARDALAQQRRSADEAAADLTGAEHAVTTAEQHLTAVDRLVALRAELTGAERAADDATAAALAAVETEAQLRRRKLQGMSSELAQRLVNGEPCTVCGSPVHPAPAVVTNDHPSDDAIESASRERQRLEVLHAHALADAAAVAARHTDAATTVDDLSRDQVAAQLDVAGMRRATAAKALLTRDRLDTEIAEFEDRTQALRSRLAEEKVLHSGRSERVTGDRKRLDADRARIGLALADRAETVTHLVAALRADRDAVVDLIEAVDACDAASSDRSAREDELATALRTGGFDDVAAAEAARLPDADVTELRATITRHEREEAVVAEGLAAVEVAALTGDEHVDVPAAEATLADREAEFATAAEEATRVGDRAQRSRAALAGASGAVAALTATDERTRPVIAMADVASASGAANLKGITLGTYVLLRRFEDVVAAANARLSMMSGGRYELRAIETKEVGSRSRKVGLALAIVDHTTDSVRDPRSFSGGETFYASLSLALGLADVVQAEAGGIDLGTLFVDEGFGSLDPETLDAVTNELGKLSSGGRVVGIVSHVEELKQRISDRIEIRALPNGSSTLRTTVG